MDSWAGSAKSAVNDLLGNTSYTSSAYGDLLGFGSYGTPITKGRAAVTNIADKPNTTWYSSWLSNPWTALNSAAHNFNSYDIYSAPQYYDRSNPFSSSSINVQGFSYKDPLRPEKSDLNPYGRALTPLERDANKILFEASLVERSGGWAQNSSAPAQADSVFSTDAADYINKAATRYGVPANLLKSMIVNESSGDWGRDGNRWHVVTDRFGNPTRFKRDGSVNHLMPYVGMFEEFASDLGFDPQSLRGNQEGQIMVMAAAMRDIYDRPIGNEGKKYGDTYGWEGIPSMYFGGVSPDNMNFTDEYGTKTRDYYNNALSRWEQYDRLAGDTASWSTGEWVGNITGNDVVSKALEFVGKVPYIWGDIPGKGTNITQWVGQGRGWDCSGFTYYLDQTYGSGQLPMGAHYQYQWAQQNSRLYDSNGWTEQTVKNLKPGDLLFFNTENQRGAGANLNPAGHVAMYIGTDGNGVPQMVHAANPESGTIISPLSGYYTSRFIGGMHMSWSGGQSTVEGSTWNRVRTPYGNAINSMFGLEAPDQWTYEYLAKGRGMRTNSKAASSMWGL